MTGKQDTVVKLLPKTQPSDQDQGESTTGTPRAARLANIGIALAAAAFLAFALMPRFPELAGLGRALPAFSGLFVLVLVFLHLFHRDIRRYRPALVNDTKKIFLLALLLLLTVGLSQLAKYVFLMLADKLPPLALATVGFALPVAAGAMLVSLLLDFHLALGFSFVVSILLGIAFEGDPFMPVYYFLVSIAAALSVIRCRKRTAVLKAGAVTGVIGFIVILGIDLYRGVLLTRGFHDLAAGFLGAVSVAMIVSATLPFFESLFDIATDFKLLELLDPNHPLLKELVYKSPGTYHHSILIGNLAEAAAEAIGENPILARVGAYYHDVGKIHKPEYYIENQRRAENKHDRLLPSMSSLIIASHVKEGVEVARRHGLPSSVIDIIRQHHGTSLITYFYQKAKELQPYVAIAEEDYRYAGPRPRTKVAAIVMLADSVEAASRTLEDPAPQRIQALTNSVITRIFLDDQLSRCDLTLKDLREISRSFNLILSGIFHHRIDYPGMELPGDRKRSDYQDKKQSEEKKAGPGKDQDAARRAASGLRSS